MGDSDHNSFSILTWHVIFYIICFVGSVSRIPYFVASCEGSFVAMHWTFWLVIYASSFLLHWCGLIALHTQRLRLVFEGTPFATSLCYPVTSAIVIAICVAALTLSLVAFVFGIDAVQRVSAYFLMTAVLGLIVTSKMIAGAFIAKFYRFNKEMNILDIEGDCDATKLMEKSTILAVISLISSVMAAIITPFTDRWYSAMTAHSLDMFANCVCVYVSLSMGSKYYDMLCGPLHRRCRECCVRMFGARNRRRKRQTHNRTISTSKQHTQQSKAATQTQTETELEVPVEIEMVSVEVLEKGADKETDALEAMRRMSRRISSNVNKSTMAHQIRFQRSSTSATITKQTMSDAQQNTGAKRRSAPIQSTLQIGVGVLAKSPDVIEFQGQSTVMDAEEEL